VSANRAPKQRKRPPGDSHLLDTVDRLKAVADPIRIRFLLELGHGPRTVKEVAEALDVPPTRLYYHLRILEQNGLVEVANKRMVSGIEERTYRVAADSWTISPDVAGSALYETGALRALFDVVRAEIEVALQSSPDTSVDDPESPLKAMAISEFAVSRDELPKLIAEFGEFLDRYADQPADHSDQDRYHFFYALYPIPSSESPEG